jgi:transketolase
MNTQSSIDQRCINAIRFLAVDAIQKANSGHPGMPMGAATMAYVLWTKHLKHHPGDPHWVDRDRFILSAGHGSMLLYALLHLTGYDISLSELQSFRQWGSRAAGHPESNLLPGVEVTTGPLGQGISNAVGMALAEAHLAACYNRSGYDIVDHFTYAIASDGDFMEGVASEACSLAGHLRLGKLIVLFDDNSISLAGSTSLTFTENVGMRFQAYGWHVQTVEDGNDINAIDQALKAARLETTKPSLISVRTVIGFGSPNKQGTFGTHGSPLGTEEVRAAKEIVGWPTEEDFYVPEDVTEHFRKTVSTGNKKKEQWEELFVRYEAVYPEAAEEFKRRMQGDLPAGWDSVIPSFQWDGKNIATRKASENILQALAPKLPELMGGSADLNPSTFSWIRGFGDFEHPGQPNHDVQGMVGVEWGYSGRNIHFGVREHAMGALTTGMAMHGGFIPYAATFLVFSDYMRPPMRLAALSKARIIYIFTHDSIGLGEDGPTHQPIEHLMNLRAMPNLTVIRPADAAETAEAWRIALLKSDGPTAIICTRQGVPIFDRSVCGPSQGLRRGGYILWQSGTEDPDVILLGTGSETHIALEAAKQLADEGIQVRVISLPSWEIFDEQPAEYRESILPSSVKIRVAVEAGIKLGWEHYVGMEGAVIGMDGFGASAPAQVLYEKFGITAERVAEAARKLLQGAHRD